MAELRQMLTKKLTKTNRFRVRATLMSSGSLGRCSSGPGGFDLFEPGVVQFHRTVVWEDDLYFGPMAFSTRNLDLRIVDRGLVLGQSQAQPDTILFAIIG